MNSASAKLSRTAVPTTLKQVITQHDPGTWLVLSRDGKILATASSADKARKRASNQRAPFLVFVASTSHLPQDSNGRQHNDSRSSKNLAKAQLNLPSFYRGVYKRVADQLGVDPSYVSRVARGERTSPAINRALENELKHSLATAQSRRLSRAAAA